MIKGKPLHEKYSSLAFTKCFNVLSCIWLSHVIFERKKTENGSTLNVNRHRLNTPKDFLFLEKKSLNNIWSRVYIKITLELFPRHLEVNQQSLAQQRELV